MYVMIPNWICFQADQGAYKWYSITVLDIIVKHFEQSRTCQDWSREKYEHKSIASSLSLTCTSFLLHKAAPMRTFISHTFKKMTTGKGRIRHSHKMSDLYDTLMMIATITKKKVDLGRCTRN